MTKELVVPFGVVSVNHMTELRGEDAERPGSSLSLLVHYSCLRAGKGNVLHNEVGIIVSGRLTLWW